MRSLLFVLCCLLLFSTVKGHPWKPNHFVVVDTDAGIDDMRALTLLLSSSDIRVLAITVSNGATTAENGYQKVKNLLHVLNKQGILVGINKLPVNEKPFQQAMKFQWTDSLYPQFAEVPFAEVLERVQKFSSEKITFISLGSLSTLDTYLEQHPDFTDRIKEVLWPIGNNMKASYNCSLSSKAFESLTTKKVPVKCINFENEKLIYETNWIDSLENIFDKSTPLFKRSLTNRNFHYSMKCNDELVPILLLNNALFQSNSYGYRLKESSSIKDIEMQISTILQSNTNNKNQVFTKFPTDTANYNSDVARFMNKTIQKFGNEEWSVCVITNELHRHIGIYSIIGAKMGVRSREYFGAGVDEMKLISYAGHYPPISCMNDGLQVSTGATTGHGLLTVLTDVDPQPKVVFEYLGQQVEFSLKEEYSQKLEKEVNQLAIIYGINGNIYWDLIRQIALNYWFNWDRIGLFEISEVRINNESEH